VTLFLLLLSLFQVSWEIPKGAILFEPPPVYAEWHAEVMECLAIQNAPSYHELEFWKVPAIPGEGFIFRGVGILAGYYDTRPEPFARIFLVSYGTDDEKLVKHEMMHHGLEPYVGHSYPPFGLCEYGVDGARWER